MSKVNTYQIAAVDRYANALFQLAKEAKVLDSVSNELIRIKEILQEDQEVLSVILNPSVSLSLIHISEPTRPERSGDGGGGGEKK